MSRHNGVPHPADEQPGPEDVELAQALESYLAAVENGRPPDPEQLLAAHPVVADRLRACLAGLRLVEGGAASLGGLPPEEADGDAPPPCLGDFRIVREVGRGGMGVVYEAEQVSLGRRVALKVLPLAATLGGTQLQRFHNEARAAAGLHHTNIVPVYFVGCERGVHFYAMQFIDGLSLATVIARLRQPADRAAAPPPADMPTTADVPPPGGGANGTASTQPAALLSTAGEARGREYSRAVAELGVQAAEALDYGHRIGVVHRDVKPGNLLLDGAGRLWVTDFGLAQMQGAESLTATGELVGTLRYMSPEQALAKRVPIDHRTDVYALGATLYELLTLQPPFDGKDRQELLRQIAFDEPRPPRKAIRAVPPELEVIVLKALEKSPADRYATAQEVADDLRRWLDDRPILARRPSLVQRLRKSARRYRAVVGAAAVGLLLTFGAVGGTVGWVARDRAVRGLAAEQAVGQALHEAQQWQEKGKVPEALSAARRAVGVALGGPTGEPLRQRALKRVADLELLERLENVRLEATAIKDDHFDDDRADDLYGQAFRDAGLDVESLPPAEAGARIRASTVAIELAAALDAWAALRTSVRGPTDASWRELLRVAQAADPDVWRSQVREALAQGNSKALDDLVGVDRIGRLLPATAAVVAVTLATGGLKSDQAEALLREAQRQHPNDFWTNYNLAAFLLDHAQPPQPEAAIRFFTAALALRPQSPGVHLDLGGALDKEGNWDEAFTETREALHLQADYVNARINLALLLKERGRYDEAAKELREALRLKPDLLKARNRLGDALRLAGRPEEAITEFRATIRSHPDSATAHIWLGFALRDTGRFADAVVALKRGHELALQTPGWHWETVKWIEESKRFLELDRKLPAVLSGRQQPADAAERVALAGLCQLPCKKRYLAAARLYEEAFAVEPKWTGQDLSAPRYDAARAAARAGCGQGEGAAKSQADGPRPRGTLLAPGRRLRRRARAGSPGPAARGRTRRLAAAVGRGGGVNRPGDRQKAQPRKVNASPNQKGRRPVSARRQASPSPAGAAPGARSVARGTKS